MCEEFKTRANTNKAKSLPPTQERHGLGLRTTSRLKQTTGLLLFAHICIFRVTNHLTADILISTLCTYAKPNRLRIGKNT